MKESKRAVAFRAGPGKTPSAAPPVPIDFWLAMERTFPATGLGTVSAFFALAQDAYDTPVSSCVPPPLVPMVHHALIPVEINKALVAVMAMPSLRSDSLTLEALGDMDASEVPVAGMPVFVGLARNEEDMVAAYLGVLMLRKILTVDDADPPIEEVVAAGVLPRLVDIVRADALLAAGSSAEPAVLQQLLFEAAWTLSNIACGASTHALQIVVTGAIPHFIAHIRRRTTADLVLFSAWAIGNLAADLIHVRDYLIAQGAVPALADCISEGMPATEIPVLRSAVWASSNLCSGKPQPSLDSIMPLLPVFANLLHHEDEDVMAESARAISLISDGSIDRVEALMGAGVLPRLVQLLSLRPEAAYQVHALRAIGSVAAASSEATLVVVHSGALAAIRQLLESSQRSIQKEACRVLSNITAGNSAHIEAVIDGRLLSPLLVHLNSPHLDVQKEATWAVANALGRGTPEQVEELRLAGAIPSLVAVTRCSDSRLVLAALESLDAIFIAALRTLRGLPNAAFSHHPCIDEVVACGGIETLVELVSDRTLAIATLARDLLVSLGVHPNAVNGSP